VINEFFLGKVTYHTNMLKRGFPYQNFEKFLEALNLEQLHAWEVFCNLHGKLVAKYFVYRGFLSTEDAKDIVASAMLQILLSIRKGKKLNFKNAMDLLNHLKRVATKIQFAHLRERMSTIMIEDNKRLRTLLE